MRKHFPRPALRGLWRRVRLPFGVDRDHDALAAEAVRGFAYELGAVHRGRVDGDLVRAGVEQVADVARLPDSAPHGQRHEHRLRGAAHDVEEDAAAFVRRRNVEKGQFVRALVVVALRDCDRVAGVAQLHEIDALDHAPVLHVQTRNDAFAEHRFFETGPFRAKGECPQSLGGSPNPVKPGERRGPRPVRQGLPPRRRCDSRAGASR